MMLSMFVNDRRDNWHKLLPFVMHTYEECSLPQDVSTPELRTNREYDVSPHPFATWVRDALEVAYDHVRESLNRTAARRKRLYDTKAVNRKFPVGSWVLRCYPPPPPHSTSWVLPGLDPSRSFVRPQVIRLAFRRHRKSPSCLFMWMIWNYARDPRISHGFRVSLLLSHYVPLWPGFCFRSSFYHSQTARSCWSAGLSDGRARWTDAGHDPRNGLRLFVSAGGIRGADRLTPLHHASVRTGDRDQQILPTTGSRTGVM